MPGEDNDRPLDPRSKAFLEGAYGLTDSADALRFYSEWAEVYDDQMEDKLGYIAPRMMAEALAPHLDDRTGLILDVGCGTGLTSRYLAEMGFSRFDGIDITPSMLARAKERGIYRQLIEADITRDLDIPDAAYDAAISSGTFTLGHVGAEPLDEICRVLKPGAPFGCSIHVDIWQPKGFAAKFAAFEAAGQMTHVTTTEGEFFTGLGRKALYCVFRKL